MSHLPSGKQILMPTVARIIESRPGLTTYLDDILGELNVPEARKPRAEASIQSCVTRLIKRGWPIQVMIAGRAWTYRPNGQGHQPPLPTVDRQIKLPTGPAPGAARPKVSRAGVSTLFELVKVLKDGALLIESEDGALYRATEL